MEVYLLKFLTLGARMDPLAVTFVEHFPILESFPTAKPLQRLTQMWSSKSIPIVLQERALRELLTCDKGSCKMTQSGCEFGKYYKALSY